MLPRVPEAETAQADGALAASHGGRSACRRQVPAAHGSSPAGSPWTACRTAANMEFGLKGRPAGLLQHLRLPEPCSARWHSPDPKVAAGAMLLLARDIPSPPSLGI